MKKIKVTLGFTEKKKKFLYNSSVFIKYGGSDEFIIIWIRIN